MDGHNKNKNNKNISYYRITLFALIAVLLIWSIWASVARGHLEANRSFVNRFVRTITFKSIEANVPEDKITNIYNQLKDGDSEDGFATEAQEQTITTPEDLAQLLSFNSSTSLLSIEGGNEVDLSSLLSGQSEDNDSDPTNELQSVVSSGGLEINSNNNFGLLTTCSDNQVLKSSSGSWGCSDDLDGGGSTSLNGLSDVNTGGVSNNEVLGFNGITWTPRPDQDTTYTAANGLSLVGTTFSVTDGNGLTVSPTSVDVNVDGTTILINGSDELQVADDSIGSTQLANDSVSDDEVNYSTVTLADFTNDAGFITSETDGVIGNEVLNATTDGGLELSGLGTSGSPFTLGVRTDCNDNEILKWDNTGSSWDCDVDNDADTTYSASNGLNVQPGNDFELGGTLERNTSLDLSTFTLNIESNELRVGDSGTIDIATGDGDLYVEDAAEIDGELRVVGLSNLQGNVDLGDAAADTITFGGVVDSAILPSTDDTFDLGSSTQRWRDLYLGPASLHLGIDGDDATISYNTATDLLNIDQNTQIAGELWANGGDIFSNGAMNIQPASGQDLNITLAGTGDFAVNTDSLFVDTDTGRVGIGTDTPGVALDVVGGLNVSGVVTLEGGVTSKDDVTLDNAHIVTSGLTPSITPEAAAGTGASAVLSGTDTAGRTTITTGASLAGIGDLVTITFASSYATAPVVVIAPSDTFLGALLDYYVTVTATDFTISTGVSPSVLTDYTFNYIVVE